MKCTQCSADIGTGARFCTRCGAPSSQPGQYESGQYQPGHAAGYSQQPFPQQAVPQQAAPQHAVPQQFPYGGSSAGATSLTDNSSLAGGWPAQASGQMPGAPVYRDTAGWAAGPSVPATRSHAAARSGAGNPFWIIAGVVAFVGAAVVLAGCFLPYAHFGGCVGCKTTSPSLLKPGAGQASEYWYAVEPVGVLLLAIVCGILLLAVRGRLAAIVAAGMLLAFGIQTVLLFAGYQFSFSGTDTRHGTAGAVGMAGGLLLIVAALFGLAANSRSGRAASS